LAHLRENLCAAKQRFTRYATAMQTRSAQLVLFYNGHRFTELSRPNRCGIAADSAPEYNDIILLSHVSLLKSLNYYTINYFMYIAKTNLITVLPFYALLLYITLFLWWKYSPICEIDRKLYSEYDRKNYESKPFHERSSCMKATIARFIAALLLVIPGGMATYGFLAMKDAIFAQFGSEESGSHILWGKMALGFVLFALGIAFIAGWVFFRDRKRNYLAPRFKAKRK
jgi:hypothetical protein